MSSNPATDSTSGLNAPATDEAPLSDLVGRLDALVQSYSVDDQGARNETTPVSAPARSARPGEVTESPAGHAAAREPTGKRVPRRELPDELKSANIMMVDDDESTILTVENYLKKEGYRSFTSTTDSREAMELLRRRDPDVVLLDIRMPEVSGLDILRAKSLDVSLEHIPVIELTATTDPNTKRCALDLGAMDFLTN